MVSARSCRLGHILNIRNSSLVRHSKTGNTWLRCLVCHAERQRKVRTMTVDEWRTRVDTVLRQMLAKMDTLDHKLDELLYEDEVDSDPRVRGNSFKREESSEFVSEEDIVSKGQKVPYNRIDDDRDLDEFRRFLSHVQDNPREFTSKELDYVGFAADKNFSDVRLSDNSRRILGTAYSKAFKKAWNFKFVRGNMYKLRGNIAWRWDDGKTD